MTTKVLIFIVAALSAASAEEAQANTNAMQRVRRTDFIIDGQTFNGFGRPVVKLLEEEYLGDHEKMSKKWYRDQKIFWKGNKVERKNAKKQHRANLKYVKKMASEQAYCALMEIPEGQVWAMDSKQLDWLLGKGNRVADCGVYTDATHSNYYQNSQDYGAMIMLEFAQVVGQDLLSKGWKRGKKKLQRKQNNALNKLWTKAEQDLFASLNFTTPVSTTGTFNTTAATSGRRLFNWNSHNSNSASSSGYRARAWATLGGSSCPSIGVAIDRWTSASTSCYWQGCGWFCARRVCNTTPARWSQLYSFSKSLCTACFSPVWPVDVCLSIHQDADCGGGSVGGCRIAGNGNACTSGTSCNTHGMKVFIDFGATDVTLYCDAGFDFGHHLFLCNGLGR